VRVCCIATAARIELIFPYGLLSTYATLCFRVPYLKIRVLPSGILSQTLVLENLATACRHCRWMQHKERQRSVWCWEHLATMAELVKFRPSSIVDDDCRPLIALDVQFYTVSQKNIPDILSCNSSKNYPTFTILDTSITEWLSNPKLFTFPPDLSSVPGKT